MAMTCVDLKVCAECVLMSLHVDLTCCRAKRTFGYQRLYMMPGNIAKLLHASLQTYQAS